MVLGGMGGRLGLGSERVIWCYVCVCCESGAITLFYMTQPVSFFLIFRDPIDGAKCPRRKL